MQPPIATLLLTPAGVCSLNNALSKAINCWFVFHLVGRIPISREKPADWTHYMLCFSPSAPFGVHLECLSACSH